MSRTAEGKCRHSVGRVIVVGFTSTLGRPHGRARVLWCADCGAVAATDGGPVQVGIGAFGDIHPGSSAWMRPDRERGKPGA